MVRRKTTPAYNRGTYDETNFYMRSKDHQGHGTTMRIPDDVAALAHQVAGSGHYPYDTAADLVRDAIVHRVHYLLETDPPAWDIQQTMKRYIALAEIQTKQREKEDVQRIIDEIMAIGDAGQIGGRPTLILYTEVAKTYPDEHQERMLAAIHYARSEINKTLAKQKI